MTSLGATGAGELGISPGTVLPGRSVHGVRPTMIPRRVLSGVNHHILLPPPPEDMSRWKCPRCLQPEVNVWHGCTRRKVQARVSTIAPPPPPPPPPPQSAPPTSPASPPDLALRKSVATLMARCTDLENRFSALEARIDELVAAQAANDSKLSTLVEAQQAIISTVTILTEKMDTVASRLEKFFESVPSPGPSSSPGRSSAPTHRTSTSKYRVR
ncbi:hypothetical protein Pcinc_011039 [Petrolisthes cinctipes]|uniref:Uncharacterized protein n=1 Tax=Petrolisthes cinctipes TaxID=88211 RepID=A0AAE1KT06_PETCI|nr:hypothetical protein Pcinc_011039 [Petrolisthes cinctipes]